MKIFRYILTIALFAICINSNSQTKKDSLIKVTTIDDIFKDPEYQIRSQRPLDFIVFPNPGNGIIQIRVFRGNYESYKVTVNNNLGKSKIFQVNWSDSINLSDFTPGFYIVTVEDELGNKVISELIITK